MNQTLKTKIAYLLPELKLGGSERHVIHLAAGLRERGYGTEIVCLFREGFLAREAREKGLPVVCLNLSYRWGMRTFLEIRNRLFSNPVDVLHACLFGFHLFAALPARLLKVPAVLSSQREIASWQKRRHGWLANFGNCFVDRVVSCSKAVENWTLEKERIRPEKVLTIYNGVDGERFNSVRALSDARREFGIPSEAPLVGTVANMAVEKGYPYLLEAAKFVLKKKPEVWFLFVGSGPLEEEMREKARGIAGCERILFAGARTDIPDLLGTMDVFVLASIVEGFPNVLLEALAMAKPVVATRVGGVPELIESGENGILVPRKDGEALGEAVLTLLKDPVEARAMGRRGEEKIRRSFTLERMVDQYEALYLSLLQVKGSGLHLTEVGGLEESLSQEPPSNEDLTPCR